MTITGVNWLSIYLGISLGIVGGLVLGVFLTTILNLLIPLLKQVISLSKRAIWKDENGVLHSSFYGEDAGSLVTVTVGDAKKPTGAPITDNIQYIGYGGGGGGSCAVPTEYQQGIVRFGGSATVDGVYNSSELGKGGAGGPGIVGMLDKKGVFHKIDVPAWNYALKDCK